MRDRARDQQHVAQVEPFEPAQVEGAAAPSGRSPSARVMSSIARERALELCLGAERADVVGHGGLQRLDHGGGVRCRLRSSPSARRSSAVARRLRPEGCAPHALRPLGCASSGAAAEHQRLGDGVAGQPIGAVGAADRFAGDQQARHLGLHALVGDDAAHVIVRDRRHLDRHLGEVDAVLRRGGRSPGRRLRAAAPPSSAGSSDTRRHAASRVRPRPP